MGKNTKKKAKVNKKEFDMRFTLFDDDSIDARKILQQRKKI